MGIFNESLQARYNEIIRRIHGMKGLPAPQVAPEINHSIVLEDDRIEHLLLGGGFPWAGRVFVVVNGVNFSQAGVRNPTGSGLIVVVTYLGFNAGAAQAAQLRTRAVGVGTQFAGSATSFFRDSRKSFGGNCPVLMLNDNANAAVFGSGPIDDVATPASQQGVFGAVPIVLVPGFEICVAPTVVSSAINLSAAGYAVPLTLEQLSTA